MRFKIKSMKIDRSCFPFSRIHATPRWQFTKFTEKISRLRSCFSFPFSLRFLLVSASLTRGSRSRFRACRAVYVRSLSVVPRVSDVSRGIARGPATARRLPSLPDLRAKWKLDVWARDAHEFIFSASCWTFFFSSRPARHQFPCMRRRPSLHSRLARDTFSWCMHMALARVHRTRFSSLLPLSLFLSFSLSSSLHRAYRTRVWTHMRARVSYISAHTPACVRVWYRWYSSRL